jgi:hypothetical protein
MFIIITLPLFRTGGKETMSLDVITLGKRPPRRSHLGLSPAYLALGREDLAISTISKLTLITASSSSEPNLSWLMR